MKALRMGVLGCARFAWRAMIPALRASPGFELVALASRSSKKAARFAERFGCEGLVGYEQLLQREDIEALYVPLPSGLHERWVLAALAAGKHLLVEKSLAMDVASARAMVAAARSRGLALDENFLFPHHSQFAWLRGKLAEGAIGELRVLRSSFTFPPLDRDDFRYDRAAGGGALLDAGCYVLKIASLLLGPPLELLGASLRRESAGGVDVQGDVMLRGARGQVAQLSFGFEHFYQCALELLGSSGKIRAERIYTPPPDLHPLVWIDGAGKSERIELPSDDHYRAKLRDFAATVRHAERRAARYEELLEQAALMDTVRREGERCALRST